MDLSKKRLPLDRAKALKRVSLKLIEPQKIMFAPVYSFSAVEQEFLLLKSPLDFFTHEELEGYSHLDFLYFSRFIHTTDFAREAAVEIRTVLCQRDLLSRETNGLVYLSVVLSQAPFEVSHAVINILSKFWSEQFDRGVSVELFFLVPFVEELLGKLPGIELERVRSLGQSMLERALVTSSLLVFLLLHLGYFDLEFLTRVRNAGFKEVVRNLWSGPASPLGFQEKRDVTFVHEVNSLLKFVLENIKGTGGEVLPSGMIANSSSKITRKMFERMPVILREIRGRKFSPPSVYGGDGIL